MDEFKLLINGNLVPGQSEMDVINPATGQVLAQCPRANEQLAQEAIDAARSAFTGWSAASLEQRREAVAKLASGIEAESEALARLLTREQGKPLAESQIEIAACVGFLQYFSTLKPEPRVIEDSETQLVEEHHRPLGVVAAIVPWNFPALLLCGKLGPALITGNTVVAKPAPTTPLTTLRIGEIAARVLPAGVLNVITDQNDLGPFLTSHPDIRKVSFTGSTATGKKVMASSAETLKRITLELGGNDAAIVLDDADPAAIAQGIYGTSFMNNGQVCIAIKRLYVHDSQYDEMVDALTDLADAAVVGDGLAPDTQQGPMQNRMQFDKVSGLIEDSRQCGVVTTGGVMQGNGGYFIRPTIVRDVAEGDRIVDEEQFGPVLPVIRYSDVDEVVARSNRTQYGLGGSVWGSDVKRAMEIAGQVEAGTVWVNKHLDFGPNIPVAGFKDSGIGVEFSEEALNEFTQVQVINVARA